MSDAESEDFDDRFGRLKDRFEERGRTALGEVREMFVSRNERAAKEFEAQKAATREVFSSEVERATSEAEALRISFEQRVAAVESEGAMLGDAHQRMEESHRKTPKQELLENTGIKGRQ